MRAPHLVSRASAVPIPRTAERGEAVALRSAVSVAPDVATAVAELGGALDRGPEPAAVLAFVTDGYDLDDAARALTAWRGDRLVACTAAGLLGARGYAREGMLAVALSGPEMTARTVRMGGRLPVGGSAARAALQAAATTEPGRAAFAVLLVDGLSGEEEAIAAWAAECLGGSIPLVGGSAGDGLRFRQAGVLVDGAFRRESATITVVSTDAPFRPFRLQHHVTDIHAAAALVVTAASPADRLIHTLNGRPAAAEYATAVGATGLDPAVFAARPLLVRAGGGEWVRAIAAAEPDGSLRMLGSVERGAVLRPACSLSAADAVESVTVGLERLRSELGALAGVLAFDSVLHRIEFEALGVDEVVGELLAGAGAAGFCTFGEQYGTVHVNQTMVGVAFGRCQR